MVRQTSFSPLHIQIGRSTLGLPMSPPRVPNPRLLHSTPTLAQHDHRLLRRPRGQPSQRPLPTNTKTPTPPQSNDQNTTTRNAVPTPNTIATTSIQKRTHRTTCQRPIPPKHIYRSSKTTVYPSPSSQSLLRMVSRIP